MSREEASYNYARNCRKYIEYSEENINTYGMYIRCVL